MVILFYDQDNEKLHICTENDKMHIISINDPNIMSHIPNDDILYVENAHYLTKEQLRLWFNDEYDLGTQNRDPGFLGKTEQDLGKRYIHPTHNGTVFLPDIKTEKYPHGLQLVGKWNFIDIDEIGQDVLESSAHYRIAIKQKKIEVVNREYVNNNIHKQKQKISPSEAALNKILIPAHIKAEAAASQGGIHGDNDIHEILVE